LFAAHDAGSANTTSAVALTCTRRGIEFSIAAGGPAVEIFERKGLSPSTIHVGNPSVQETLDSLLSNEVSALICGSSHSSMLERHYVESANRLGIPSLSILDWWSSYAERFSTPGTADLQYLPTWIGVSDEYALRGAVHDGLPHDRLLVTGNPYWDRLQSGAECPNAPELRERVRANLSINNDTILATVIVGLARNLDLGLGSDERDMFRELTPLPECNREGKTIRWFALRHPSEDSDSFRAFLEEVAPNIETTSNANSLEMIVASDVVVGLISTLQFEAALLGRKVLCLAPGGIMSKMPFVEVFNAVGIPAVLDAAECRHVLNDFLDSSEKTFDRSRLPESITCRRSADCILDKILEK
jgi:hypothetical protein